MARRRWLWWSNSRNKAIASSSLSVILISKSEHNWSVSQEHMDESDSSQEQVTALIGGSPTLLSYHRCKVYVPPSCEDSSACGRLSPLHGRTCDGAEGRYSRHTVRRSQHSNEWDRGPEGCFFIGVSTVGHSVCAKNICAVAEDQCPQNLAGLRRSVDWLSQVSGTLLFSPLLTPLSRHHCFLVWIVLRPVRRCRPTVGHCKDSIQNKMQARLWPAKQARHAMKGSTQWTMN